MKKKHFLLFVSAFLLCSPLLMNQNSVACAASQEKIIFSNGEFYSEVTSHGAGSTIEDGTWQNNGGWNASRVYLKDAMDLSSCESLTFTYVNVGTATYCAFGLGNVPGGSEYDYVEVGKTLVSDGNEHEVTIDLAEYSNATEVKCSWAQEGHSDRTLDLSNIKAMSMNAGNVVVHVSKITAKVKETKKYETEIAILKDGNLYSSITQSDAGANFSDGVWKNNAGWSHSRSGFEKTLDLTWFDTFEITYTATSTASWANNIDLGFGNMLAYGEYHFYAKNYPISIDGSEQVLTANLQDFRNQTISCSWGTAGHNEGNIDFSKWNGFSVKGGNITFVISKITVKSSVLAFVNEVKAFDLCSASNEEIKAMLDKYQNILLLNEEVKNFALEETTSLGERMDYMTSYYAYKTSSTGVNANHNTLLQSQKRDLFMIVFIGAIGLIGVGIYYFIRKAKLKEN